MQGHGSKAQGKDSRVFKFLNYTSERILQRYIIFNPRYVPKIPPIVYYSASGIFAGGPQALVFKRLISSCKIVIPGYPEISGKQKNS
jgi:hypothetical protein